MGEAKKIKRTDTVEQLSALEAIAWDPGRHDECSIALVLLGEKPSALVSFLHNAPSSQAPEKFFSKAQPLRRLLTDFGITFIEQGPDLFEETKAGRTRWRLVFLIAESTQALQKLSQAWDSRLATEEKLFPADHAAVGRALGFPESAVTAFPDRIYKIQDLPEPERSSPAGAFLIFTPSQDGWREEMKLAERWARTIEKYAPELYRKRLEWYREQNQRDDASSKE